MVRKEQGQHKFQTALADNPAKDVSRDEWNDDHNMTGMESYDSTTATITISAGGALLVTDTLTIVAANSGVTDDLDNITTTNTVENDTLLLFADTGDTITVRDAAGGAGQIHLNGDVDRDLTQTTSLWLIRRGADWHEYNLSVDFEDADFRIHDNADDTKKVAFELSGITTATTRTLTIPDANGTIIITGLADQLTDTELTSGVFAKITGVGAQSQALDMNTQILQFVDANQTIQNNTGNFLTDVATGQVHLWRVNNVTKMQLSATALDLQSNALLTTGAVRITGGTMRIPLSATPTMAVDGDFAIDTTVTDFSHGVLKFFDGEEIGVVAMPIAEFTTPTDGHVVTYNATNDEFELVAGGGGSDTPWTEDHDAAEFNLINIGLLNLKIDNTTTVLELEANHTTPADGQVIGQTDFIDDSSTGVRRIYGQITTVISDPTNTIEKAEMFFKVANGGSIQNFIALNDAEGNDVTIFKNLDMSGAAIKNLGNITHNNGGNIVLGTGAGTKIGEGTTQKLGFWNATPIVQPSHIVDADGTLADITTKFNTLLAQMASTGLQAAA